MERQRKQQLLEQGIYVAIWVVVFLLPLIGGYFAMSGGLEKLSGGKLQSTLQRMTSNTFSIRLE